ncbi:alternative ribosome rescue aminoacyl-tRNA hydrolase ArfB [Mucilaginibacter sp.]
MNINRDILQKEVFYKTSRSGGKGGQNVNKVSTKVELLFSVNDSVLFNDDEKVLLNDKLQSRFNKDGLIQVICDEDRSQYMNKQKALERLIGLLAISLHKPKVRKKKGISKAYNAARLENKKINSAKKKAEELNLISRLLFKPI